MPKHLKYVHLFKKMGSTSHELNLFPLYLAIRSPQVSHIFNVLIAKEIKTLKSLETRLICLLELRKSRAISFAPSATLMHSFVPQEVFLSMLTFEKRNPL